MKIENFGLHFTEEVKKGFGLKVQNVERFSDFKKEGKNLSVISFLGSGFWFATNYVPVQLAVRSEAGLTNHEHVFLLYIFCSSFSPVKLLFGRLE